MNEKKSKGLTKGMKRFLAVWLAVIAVLLALIFLIGLSPGHEETIKEVMKDGVLHEENRIALFGLEVNPGLISAITVSGILLAAAALIRLIAIPRFSETPGRLQGAFEKLVEFFRDMAKGNSPHRTGFVAAYIFSAGVYIFFSTIFELFGIQAVTTKGLSIALPAPIADINAAIAMGVLSYGIILGAGIVSNGFKGALGVLKDFSLPVSMSFRLFGALLSGLLVTELVYYYVSLSFVLPVVVGVMFTILHALIQAYVLTTLVSVFYGEAVEPKKKKAGKGKKSRMTADEDQQALTSAADERVSL